MGTQFRSIGINVSVAKASMVQVPLKPLTFEEFLNWDDGTGRNFELIDGFPMPVSDPNANHEDLAARLSTYMENLCVKCKPALA